MKALLYFQNFILATVNGELQGIARACCYAEIVQPELLKVTMEINILVL